MTGAAPARAAGKGADAAFFVGVDCGATSMRVLVADRAGAPRATAKGVGSNLLDGPDRCWALILEALAGAFATGGMPFEPGRCMVGVGIAGGHHQPSLDRFEAEAPAFAALAADTDSFVHLLGAHGGKPGSIAAFGTGSVGESLLPDGSRRLIGGYGFPAGDRASGAWLGQQASQHLQDALDRVVAFDGLAEALRAAIGQETREGVQAWLSHASPSDFGALVPTVLSHRAHPVVQRLLARMGEDAAAMIMTLKGHGAGPVALCGGLAPVIEPLLPPWAREGLVAPAGDGKEGAVILIRRRMEAAIDQ